MHLGVSSRPCPRSFPDARCTHYGRSIHRGSVWMTHWRYVSNNVNWHDLCDVMWFTRYLNVCYGSGALSICRSTSYCEPFILSELFTLKHFYRAEQHWYNFQHMQWDLKTSRPFCHRPLTEVWRLHWSDFFYHIIQYLTRHQHMHCEFSRCRGLFICHLPTIDIFGE